SPIGYWSPERLAGAPPLPSDDVWAAGVTLYFMLTGAMPFDGTTTSQLRASIAADGPVHLRRYGIGAARLERILEHVLAPRMSERLMLASAMLSALASWKPGLRSTHIPAAAEQGLAVD